MTRYLTVMEIRLQHVYNIESFRVSLLLEKPTNQPLKFKCEQSNMMKLSLCGGNQDCIWVDIFVCKTHRATRSVDRGG